ncbi:hypothetical protein IJ118_01815 [Candidatus Saccharibacteria bacterium]|nr:hypothetical protein [Candidatus Saccharibacteria bacterium]
MKLNRKVVLSTAVVLGASALVAGGTIAYFTDHESKTNNFTAGDVEIEMYESQLHRENSGRAATFAALASDPYYCDYNTNPTTYFGNASLISGSYNNARYCTPGMAQNTYSDNENDISAIKNGHTAPNRYWGFTDQVIKSDAATYATNYLANAAADIVPGEWIRKFTYVENTSTTEPAYVLIRYKVPANVADYVTLKVPGTPYEEDTNTTLDGVQPYFTAVTASTDATSGNTTYTAYALTANGIDDYAGYTEGDYKVYAAVTTQPLNAGEMSFWSPINTVKINNDATEAQITALGLTDNTFGIIVEADAIQAKTFNNAIEAINNL